MKRGRERNILSHGLELAVASASVFPRILPGTEKAVYCGLLGWSVWWAAALMQKRKEGKKQTRYVAECG